MSTTSTPTSDVLAERMLSNFQPLHNPALSPIPDLMAWVKKQDTQFQLQMTTMPIEVFRDQFKTYCPNCLLDHKTMTGKLPIVGMCIQCQYFLATGLRGAAQHK